MKKTTILIIVVLFMVIGYAAYNTTINIYGNGKLAENLSDFKVYLSNLKVNGTEIEGINEKKDGYEINIPSKGTLEYDVINDSTEYDVEATIECQEENEINEITNFDYTGGEQTFIAPVTGTYKLETWGAQGGSNWYGEGGFGGYSIGNINLNINTKLFINVGSKTGYNGGNYMSGVEAPGGGATHISTITGLLSSLENYKSNILIVSGGGGAGERESGGSGGGYIGGTGYVLSNTHLYFGTGGTQSSGGSGVLSGKYTNNLYDINGSFGSGGLGNEKSDSGPNGGGGYYGGGATTLAGGAGGGSGYIGNPLLTEKSMHCYNCAESTEESTKTISTTCVNETPTESCAKKGNGYARITLINGINSIIQLETTTIEAQDKLSKSVEVSNNGMKCSLKIKKLSRTEKKVYNGPTEWTFDYTGGEQTFIAPVTGTYKLETWGAQGSSSYNGVGGYGGYSVGYINLNVNRNLFINVGGKGGYNGGNLISGGGPAGGGATHVSTITGLLSNLENYKSNVLIVSGGGGAGERQNGGSGGGYIGATGYALSNSYLYFGTGGTQSSGGSGVFSGQYTNNLYDINGSFGTGGLGNEKSDSGPNGGGGYYGGGATTLAGGAGGGSGYIGNSLLTEKVMYCYNCTESTEESTKTISTTCVNSTPTENCAKTDNGYARITLISK